VCHLNKQAGLYKYTATQHQMSNKKPAVVKTKEEIAHERHRTSMKHFDLAEAPVKAWIAKYINRRPEELYHDWQEEYETLNVSQDGQYYMMYWSPEDAAAGDVRWDIDVEDFKKAPELQRAGCMMLEAIKTVYSSCTAVMEQEKQSIEDNDIVPYFEESTMSYKFGRLDKLRRLKNKLEREVLQAADLLKRVDQGLKSCPSNTAEERDKRAALIEQREKLVEVIGTTSTEHNNISEEECQAEKNVCDEWNARLENGPRLYLYLKRTENIPIERRVEQVPIQNIGGARYVDQDDDLDD
jgi:hypothetical protein